MSNVGGNVHTVLRTPSMIASDANDDYLLCLVTDGRVEVTQNERTTEFGAGEFVILDSAAPFEYRCLRPFHQIVVRAPKQLLTARLPGHTMNEATARAISATSGSGLLVGNIISGIASIGGEVPYGSAASFSSSALDIVVTALAETPATIGATATARHRDLIEVKHAIERNLHDPDHTLTEIAAEVGMSVRYIQKLFAASGGTPRAWLSRARLDRARKYLLATDLTVAEISEQVGFRDVSHFSRSFRAHFGVSPGQYRVTGGQRR